MLKEMWKIQREFYEKIRKEKPSLNDQQFCHSIVLHLHKEVSELLDAVGGAWKTHVKESTGLRKSQILMEVVDITKLSWEVAIAAGVTSEELYDAFVQKSIVVDRRRSNEKLLEELNKRKTPVVVFDFDGVLVRYPEGFLHYCKHASLGDISIEVDALKSPDDLWTQMGIPLEKYQNLKREFIEFGGLRSLQPIGEAWALVNWLKLRGYKVVIVTSRDKTSLEKMELDSYRWLIDHEAESTIDGIYFSLDKARFIREHFDSAVLVVEDHALEVSRLKEAGIPAMCIKRPYNKDGYTFEQVREYIDFIEKEKNRGNP